MTIFRLASAISSVCFFLAFPAASQTAQGQTVTAQDSPGEDVTCKTNMEFVFATTLETKLKLVETVSVPFHNGSTIQLKLGAEVSPVSVNATLETVWTPVPFFQLVGGASAGSAWNIPIAHGLCLNGESGLEDADLSGVVWMAKGGWVFQFDFAAINPGKWNHIVFRAAQELRYRAFTGAAAGESWLHEGDDGENRNGWNYYATYFVGYQMPIMLDTAGVLVEQEQYLYGISGGDLWGDNRFRWIFGPVVNFTISKQFSASLAAQFRSQRNYTQATENEEFYQNRVLDTEDPLRIEFYRAAVVFNMKIK